MKEIRNNFGDLVAYELELHMTSAEAGPGDESRVTLESSDWSAPYRGERLTMDMADEDIRRHFGEKFKVTVSPVDVEARLKFRDEPGQGIPAFADLCENNAAAVASATCDDLKAAWSIGDELRMHLKASEDGRQPEQDVVWVVMGFDCKRVLDDGCCTRDSRAVIGLKDGLEELMRGGGEARGWLLDPDRFSSMLPGWFRDLFCETKIYSRDYGEFKTYDLDLFWLPSETEVFGCTQWSDGDMERLESQLPYYTGRRDRRVKHRGIGGRASDWLERSPCSDGSGIFCYVNSDGSADWIGSSETFLLSPCGCF